MKASVQGTVQVSSGMSRFRRGLRQDTQPGRASSVGSSVEPPGRRVGNAAFVQAWRQSHGPCDVEEGLAVTRRSQRSAADPVRLVPRDDRQRSNRHSDSHLGERSGTTRGRIMALLDALTEWEEAWRTRGVPVDDLLAPGLHPDEIRAAIDFAPVHDDAITWYSWRNGAKQPTARMEAVPSGRILTSLSEALRERDSILSIGADEGIEGTEDAYGRSWLPVASSESVYLLSLDLNRGEVFRSDVAWGWSTEYPLWHLQIGDNLETLVRTWIAELARGDYLWNEGGWFDYDGLDQPMDLRSRHVLG